MTNTLQAQKEFILQCQLPSGAFKLAPQSDVINPYFTNLALVPIVQLGGIQPVTRYIDWFLTHLTPQSYINDYRYTGGKEVDTGKADSEDSYVATFFSLVLLYMEKSGDTAYLRHMHGKLRSMLHTLLGLQQQDGLTWAKRSYRVKYLMDNCEVVKGLEDVAALFTLLDDHDSATLALERAALCREGVLGMYDAKKKCFAMYDRTYPTWTKWYPDATSQAFPILYGIVEPKEPRAKSLYSQMTERFPRFEVFQTGDFFPWMSMGNCAMMMGDMPRVKRMLEMAETMYIYGPRQKYWLLHEAGRYMRLSMTVQGVG